MSKRFIAHSARTFVIASVALGSLAAMLTQPAAAKKLNACQVKHSYCSERCIMRYDGAGVGACIKRTCDRQHRGCGSASFLKGPASLLAESSAPVIVARKAATPKRRCNPYVWAGGPAKCRDHRSTAG